MVDITPFINTIVLDLLDVDIKNWKKAILNIESTLSFVSTGIDYFDEKNNCLSHNEKSLSPQSKIVIIKMHRTMEQNPSIFEKWNKAYLYFDKESEKTELKFEWNQEFQDKISGN